MKMIIGGEQVDSLYGETIDVINPSTGKKIDSVPSAKEEDVKLAVEKALDGQKIWREFPVYKRVSIIQKFISLLEKEKEVLAQLLCEETGKPIKEARIEIGNVGLIFNGFSEKVKHLYDEIIPSGLEPGQKRNVVLTKREPLGVIGCIVPFNFPCDLYSHKVAPALLTGNAAIIKPSSDAPLTLCRITMLLAKAGVTPGAIQIITGRGSKIGHLLCSNKNISGITLTGSTEVGIETAKTTATNLTHVSLELGGNDPFILMEDGNVDLAVRELIFGRMYNSGQVCCASKRFIIHESKVNEFTEKAIEKISKLKHGKPIDENTEISCLISEKAAIKVENQIKHIEEQGGKVVLGGKRKGAFVEPTIIAGVPKEADVMKDMEVFGPVVPITSFTEDEEAINIANSSRYGLCGCVFTENMRTATDFSNRLECGTVVVNGASFFRSIEMPFGGYKDSGLGREGVMTSLKEMTQSKNIVLKNIL